jgi:hypothetical protein
MRAEEKRIVLFEVLSDNGLHAEVRHDRDDDPSKHLKDQRMPILADDSRAAACEQNQSKTDR